jgi:excisionase family DNA binding protein
MSAETLTQPNPMIRDGFANIDDAGKFLRLSRATLYKLMENGSLAYAKMGRARRVPWRALHEYAQKSLVGA